MHTLRFNGHFPGEPELAGCPLNSPSLHVFLDCTSFWDRPKLSMSFLTQSHRVFSGHPLCRKRPDVITLITEEENKHKNIY